MEAFLHTDVVVTVSPLVDTIAGDVLKASLQFLMVSIDSGARRIFGECLECDGSLEGHGRVYISARRVFRTRISPLQRYPAPQSQQELLFLLKGGPNRAGLD